MKELFIYNTLTRTKEKFKPVNPPHVGLYVCGPTVYGDPHLGHARPAVTFDILFRYLRHLGYKVRYIRNITDVGHLEDEMTGEGEDRIEKKARLEQLEPMEVVQHYTNRYHTFMDRLNVLPPSIEPHASGHIIEQQQIIRSILNKGFAYEINGSVYFDLKKYNEQFGYGILSGRNLEDMQSNTRELEGQDEKRYPLDFALWKKADLTHIMHWPSEWSEGFPGWHLECSAMGMKYLGDQFDIHGGGMDLIFPHHECELAQSTVVTGRPHVRYWMHNNMITINGQKMSKSKNNFITLEELFTGKNILLEQPFSPMTIRFYMLQAHYSSPVDFSNEALKAAEQGLNRLMKGLSLLPKLKASASSTVDVITLQENAYTALSDDLNCPVLLGILFDGIRIINSVKDQKESITAPDLEFLKTFMHTFVFDLLGLTAEDDQKGEKSELFGSVVKLLLQQRQDAKTRKDYAASDNIRNQLATLGIMVKDTKEGMEWERE
ncbi:MAG TPA: cysteine--tRNA ligase [Bacteroidales bacterium]|nr:cysteine--tRNA ligase [Bacteroidales bacterium]